jgi:DNA replication protein DnaC
MKTYWLPAVPVSVKATWLLLSAIRPVCSATGCFYAGTPKLAKLKMAKADGSYIKELAKLERTQLLILDDFGIQPFDAQSRAALMELIEDRHGKTSLIITSQLLVSKWFEVIGEKTVVDAILDRMVHDAHRIELKGESMRRKRSVEPTKSY